MGASSLRAQLLRGGPISSAGPTCAAVALVLFAACAGPRPAAAAGTRAGAAPPATATESPAPTDGARPPLEAEAEAVDPPPSGDALPELKPAADEPAELTELKARLLKGDTSTRVVKALQKLSYKHPKIAAIPFLLGQLYLGRLWVDDGLKLFRKAIELNPIFRSNPFLIRSVINGLGNDRDQSQVRRFLSQEIGKLAAPYLEEVLHGEWRQQVKDRASAILSEIESNTP